MLPILGVLGLTLALNENENEIINKNTYDAIDNNNKNKINVVQLKDDEQKMQIMTNVTLKYSIQFCNFFGTKQKATVLILKYNKISNTFI